MRVTNHFFALVAGLLLLLSGAPLRATPLIQTWQTPEGVPVLFVAAPDLPMLDVRIAFQAGSARDGDQPGLASLTANLLDQGAGEWDANTIAERLEAVGAEMSIDAQRDMASASLRSLTRQPALNQALETLALVISQPRFAESDFERMRAPPEPGRAGSGPPVGARG